MRPTLARPRTAQGRLRRWRGAREAYRVRVSSVTAHRRGRRAGCSTLQGRSGCGTPCFPSGTRSEGAGLYSYVRFGAKETGPVFQSLRSLGFFQSGDRCWSTPVHSDTDVGRVGPCASVPRCQPRGQPWKALARPRSCDAWDRRRWVQALGLKRLERRPERRADERRSAPARDLPHQQHRLPKQLRLLRQVQRTSK